jgi:hypothetical protein
MSTDDLDCTWRPQLGSLVLADTPHEMPTSKCTSPLWARAVIVCSRAFSQGILDDAMPGVLCATP